MQQYPNLIINTDIFIECKTEKEVKTLYNSLLPDNKEFPPNLILKMQTNGSTFIMNLKFSKAKHIEDNINTIINTIDELMEHITIIKDMIKND